MTVEVGHCDRCDKDVRPFVEMQPTGRMLDVCPYCQSMLRSEESAQLSVAPATEAHRPAHHPAPVPAAAQGTFLDQAKARLARLEAELETYESKVEEAKMLRRMIAAATEH